VYETASGEVVQSWNSPGAIRVGVLPTMDFAVECCSLNYNRGNLLYFVRATRLGELADPHLPEIVTDIPVQAARIHQFAVSPDGRYYLYAAQSWGPERKPVGDVIVATVAFSEDRKKFLTNEKNRFKGTSACFDPSNKKHLVTAFQKTVTMCDIDSGKPLNALAPADAEITCVAISKDGTRVAAGCRDGNVVVWNAQAGQRLAECHGHDGSVSAVAFAPNGTSIATGGDDSTVRIWDASSGDQIVKYAHEGPVYALTCSSVGVISGSADRTIRLWKLPE
jgi:WD40 repeat protein